LSNDLGAVLDDGCMESEERKCNLNKVKMVCYLLTQYIDLFETEDTQPSATQVVTAKVDRNLTFTLNHNEFLMSRNKFMLMIFRTFCFKFLSGIYK